MLTLGMLLAAEKGNKKQEDETFMIYSLSVYKLIQT